MSRVSGFGVDLNSSNFELHPSINDSKDQLQGTYCATIRLSDPLTTDLLDFVENHRCYHGMQIGTMQFMSAKTGAVTLDNRISQQFSNCKLTIRDEIKSENIEIYQTEYDPPPSNAMLLRRKGFVFSKLALKSTGCRVQSDRSRKIAQSQPQRASSNIKRVKPSIRMSKKRQSNQLNLPGPPNKRLRTFDYQNNTNNNNQNNRTILERAVSEILYLRPASFERVQTLISNRTSIKFNQNELNSVCNKIANYTQHDALFHLREEYHTSINVMNSTVLIESEKQSILNRHRTKTKTNTNNDINNNNDSDNNNKSNGTNNKKDLFTRQYKKECEEKYQAIKDYDGYNKYNNLFHEKDKKYTQISESLKANEKYFRDMRNLIKNEKDETKKSQMTSEFRKIFEQRKSGMSSMRQSLNKIPIELQVIKNRINHYVTSQS